MGGRELSFWAWGYADKLPDADARRALAGMVEAVLGFRGLAPEEPVALADARVPAARIDVPPELAAFTTADREARARHTYGRAYRDLVRGFRGDFSAAPDLVALPRDEADVEAALRVATREAIAVFPYGGGTSVVGGVEPALGPGHRATLSLDLARMAGVPEVDAVSRAARILAGTKGPAIEAALATHGLSLRHYPQSFEHSTLGGWIATRAGGHYATLATHIDDLVESIRMIGPTGAWQSRRLPSSGAGPRPDALALGSEGTLGVITEAWLRVVPRPTFRSRATVLFDDLARAVAACRAVAQSGLHPANCRLLEAREAMLNGVVAEPKHVLLLAFESADHPLDAWIDRAIALAVAEGGACPGGARSGGAADAWKSAFLEAPYLQSAFVSLGLVADTFETAVTWAGFDALHAEVRAAIAESTRGEGVVTARFTHVYPDGPAPYFTFLVPARRGDEIAQWGEIKRAVSDAIARSGGTITHHHAVGRVHRPWYERERPEPFGRALAAVKRALDPAGILAPGVLVDG